MKERPILFSAPMVHAILDGRKTQTRRICKGQRELSNIHDFQLDRCPYGKPGDRLWVRETFAPDFEHNRYFYRADCDDDGTVSHLINGSGLGGGVGNAQINKWKPSIHMPRWASRILLEVTNVRVERLNDISEDDCYAEGIEELDGHFDEAEYCAISKKIGCCIGDSKPTYVQLWESINGQESWSLNPWVWVVEFKVLEIARKAA
ncbi:hypothetical protein R2083_08330 [Nitrosomonas sp. Is35]|uniref:hypothetical protein n=1 Tax=Nitrosomonas sp. Is35 TaxID=3080534 RepID=UPI00294AA8BE|nr:hypothetical protein [Nitrosomonas sp. Is35]MDV6347520.1 hypothetical protein [Nitrosomonas sp. Is35]